MNESSRISQNDPRLTAYALGEMEPADRAEFEQLLEQDPVAQRQVEETIALGRDLDRALSAEPLPPPSPMIIPVPAHDTLPKVSRFPYYWVSGLAAACFAVGFIAWQAQYEPPPQTRIIEVNLQPPATTAGDAARVATNEAPAPVFVPPAAPAAQADPASTVIVMELPSVDSRAAVTVAQAEAEFNNPSLAPAAGPVNVGGATLTEPALVRTGPTGDEGRSRPAETKAASSEMVAVALPVAPASGHAAQDSLIAGAPAHASAGSVGASAGIAADEKIELSAFTVTAERPARRFAAKARAKQEVADQSSVRGYFQPAHNTEAYDHVTDNPFIAVAHQPLSTFSIDVDTASYANIRRFLQGGARPPRDAVRIEELVNYFPYDYAGPQDRDMPFAAAMEVASAPWQPEHRLVRIGLKGREIPAAERPDANLVFLIDVSGSMQPENKLPLVKRSLRLLVEQLRPDDRVALAVYAGSAGLVLPSTRAADKRAILEAIDRLEAGGSTNGAMGIQLAYDIAKANFIAGGVNRLILCTDGDFNVGVTNRGDLVRLVEEKAKGGVFLTVLGFGMGNYKDATLEQLADRGNGNHGYIDSLREAQKLLVEQAGGTLVTIAKDVKIQVDFNPAQVQAYRLIGYENRLLRAEDFNNDKIDAGEIGAGHTVTALYEVVPVGVDWKPESTVDASKYQVPSKSAGKGGPEAASREMLTLKLRYKAPDGIMSRLREFPLVDAGAKFEDASMDFRFAASVAAFGMILRESPHKGTATLADVTVWASSGTGRDAGGHRTEFLGLVKLAEPMLK